MMTLPFHADHVGSLLRSDSLKQAYVQKKSGVISEEASHYFPKTRMGISPQCGFATVAPGNPLTEADQWRKLELVVDVANSVWAAS